MPVTSSYQPDPRFLTLGPGYSDPVKAAVFPEAVLRFRNQRAAGEVGLGALTPDEFRKHFWEFAPLPDNLPVPLALRYHGHQFRAYNPDIGDGRGFLFAQLRDASGRLLDLGTKGSGKTPYSRFGDGRLTLKGAVREVLATGLLEARGVSTSCSFAVFETGEKLSRNDEPSPTRSAVLTRLSHSHVRVGAFQRLAYMDENALMARLIDYVLDVYYPRHAPGPVPALTLFEAVRDAVAATAAQWMAAGFVHGVLNTDNINITGESFDYGPWRFLPKFDSGFTAAYFDETGLYAYGRQPGAVAWNLARFAECLLPFAPQADLEAALQAYGAQFEAAWRLATLARLGLKPSDDAAEDMRAVLSFYQFLETSGAPFEQAFFDWRGGALSAARAEASPASDYYRQSGFAEVRARLEKLEPVRGALDAAYFQGAQPCDMLIDEVEAIWAPIAASDDWSAFNAKCAAIDALREAYAAP